MLHPDVDRMREEPGPRLVIRHRNEMGRKVAKWLPGGLVALSQGAAHIQSKRGINTFIVGYVSFYHGYVLKQRLLKML